MTDIRTLVLDIETFPTQAYVWGLFDQNVGLNQIVEPGDVMSWSAKWAGEDEVYFSGLNMATPAEMLAGVWEMMDEADEIVGWNSNSFDLKLLNAGFAVQGWGPPSPYKKVDLMRIVKTHMRFVSNKLDFISGAFGEGSKVEHEGFPLWVACMQGSRDAWKKMQEYNEGDVLLTESMYNRLRGWIHTGVNRSAESLNHVCPTCGGSHLQSRGMHRTTTMLYNRWHCQSCGAWSRTRLAEKQDRSKVLVPAR